MPESEIAKLTIDTSFEGKVTVKLIEVQTDNNKPSCIVDCNKSMFDYSGDKTQRLAVGGGYIAHLLRELEESPVPALPTYTMGCDGTSYELTLIRGLNGVTYRWWCEAPKSYAPIVKFANEMLKLARCNELSIQGVTNTGTG